MLLPKGLNDKPTINVTYVINGVDSQVFFDFDKSLVMKTPEDVEAFLVANKIKHLTEEFLQILKSFLREVPLQ